MKRLGRFEIESIEQFLHIDLKTLKVGLNDLQDYIVKINENNEIVYVIDKVCDHAGGKLMLKKGTAVCPMHNWHLNLDTLKYNDSLAKKVETAYSIDDSGQLIINAENRSLKNPFRPNHKGKLTIRWINHATVYIECNGVTLLTDPWLFGPAFLTGWWLYDPSPIDAIELLKKVDYVYISHNHPDHLHAETLSILSKETAILTPNFHSGSAENFLRKLGFNNIIPCDFLDIIELGENFQISILKSGDFRDDSGIYVCANGNELLLTVDSNYLNHHVLPTNIDLLMTSFAGGASGFPLCYENYSEEEKAQVVRRNRNSIKSNVINYMKETSPRYYMPYAGMFAEYSERDSYVKERNAKNAFEEYIQIALHHNVEVLRPESNKRVQFENGEIEIVEIPNVDYLQKEITSHYISNLKLDYPFNPAIIIAYLKNSNYKKKQILQLIPTDDNFNNLAGEIIYADFYEGQFKKITEKELIQEKEGYNVMQMKIRAEVIMCVVSNFLPWEDLSIGFQMRVKRFPNEYEIDFWYHFTNIYIAKENFRYSTYCGACSIINQNPIWINPNVKELVITEKLS
jgi:CMP-N-acetylneuraminate monooxygenase